MSLLLCIAPRFVGAAEPANSAIEFGSSSQRVIVGDDPRLKLTNSFTLELWIHPSGFDIGQPMILLNREGEYELGRFSNGNLHYAISSASPGWAWIDTGVPLPANVWTHIAFVFDHSASAVRVYRNGALAATQAATGPIGDFHPDHNEFHIGGRQFEPLAYFSGRLDEVRIWNRVRSTEEVAANFNWELIGDETGLIGCWPFNEAGATAADISPNALNASVLGGAARTAGPALQTIALSSTSVPEQAASGFLAGVFSVAGPASSFALVSGAGGEDNESFVISSSELRTAAVFDLDTRSSVSIRARVTLPGGAAHDRVFHLAITNAATLSASPDFFPENLPAGSLVTTLAAPALDPPVVYSLVDGAGSDDNGRFAIVGGRLLSLAPFDYETQSVARIRARAAASSGETIEQALTLAARDVNEGQPALSATSFQVFDGATNGTLVGQLSATDADVSQTLTFALFAGNTGGAFALDSSGRLTVANTAALNSDVQSLYNLGARVTDNGAPPRTSISQVQVTVAPPGGERPRFPSRAVEFSGSSHVGAGFADALHFAENFTLEAWVYPSLSAPAHRETILSRAGEYELVRSTAGTLQFRVANQSAGWVWTDTVAALPANQWSHIAVVSDTTEIRAYRNGTLVHTEAASGEIENSGGPFWIGSSSLAEAEGFTGRIDEVRAWTTARSVNDIAADRFRILENTPDGLAAFWRFEETGSIADDQGPNNLPATLGEGMTRAPGAPLGGVRVRGAEDTDLVIALPGEDPEGEACLAVIETLPAHGALFQWQGGVAGSPITPLQTVSDSQRRVIYRPSTNAYGAALSSFRYRVKDAFRSSLANFEVVADVDSFLDPPSIVTPPLVAAFLPGETLNYTISLTEFNDVDWSALAVSGLPDGMVFDLATRVISGPTPFTDAFTVGVSVRGLGPHASTTLTAFIFFYDGTPPPEDDDGGGGGGLGGGGQVNPDFGFVPTSGSIPEDAAPGLVAGYLTFTQNIPVEWAITGWTAGDPSFAVPGPALIPRLGAYLLPVVLLPGAELDYETRPYYEFSFFAKNLYGRTLSFQVSIHVANVSELPPAIPEQSFNLAENSPAGTIFGTVTATDPDAGQPVRYEIADGDGTFAVDPETGMLAVADPSLLDYEARISVSFTLAAFIASNPGLRSTRVITVHLSDVNESAPSLADTGAFSIAENSPAGTFVGALAAADADGGSDVHFELQGSGGPFAIDSNTGLLTVSADSLLDFERQSSFNLAVLLIDSGSPTRAVLETIQVQITDVNEFAPAVPDTVFSIAEDAPAGTIVGEVLATDADTADTIQFAIASGNTGGAFAIDALTGEITVASAAALDFESMPQFTLEARATDSGAPSRSSFALVTVNLADVNDAPVAASDILIRPRGRGAKIKIAQLLANDSDPEGESVSFLRINPASALGGVVERDGQFIFYEPPPDSNISDSFTYVIQDARGAGATGTVTVTLAAADNAETMTRLSVASPSPGQLRLTFIGLPGRSYIVEATPSLSTPDWQPVDTQNASAGGIYEVTYTIPIGQAQQFFRALQN